MKPFKITFEESKPRAMLQTIPDYWVLLNGKRVERLYWNTRGYRGALPTPEGGLHDPGEVSLARFKKEARALEREAKALETAS
jgi:hypothetical protein